MKFATAASDRRVKATQPDDSVVASVDFSLSCFFCCGLLLRLDVAARCGQSLQSCHYPNRHYFVALSSSDPVTILFSVEKKISL